MPLICLSFKKINRVKLCNVLRAILQYIITTNLRTWYWCYFSLLPWLILLSFKYIPLLPGLKEWAAVSFLVFSQLFALAFDKVNKKPRNSCDRSSSKRKKSFSFFVHARGTKKKSESPKYTCTRDLWISRRQGRLVGELSGVLILFMHWGRHSANKSQLPSRIHKDFIYKLSYSAIIKQHNEKQNPTIKDSCYMTLSCRATSQSNIYVCMYMYIYIYIHKSKN